MTFLSIALSLFVLSVSRLRFRHQQHPQQPQRELCYSCVLRHRTIPNVNRFSYMCTMESLPSSPTVSVLLLVIAIAVSVSSLVDAQAILPSTTTSTATANVTATSANNTSDTNYMARTDSLSHFLLDGLYC